MNHPAWHPTRLIAEIGYAICTAGVLLGVLAVWWLLRIAERETQP